MMEEFCRAGLCRYLTKKLMKIRKGFSYQLKLTPGSCIPLLLSDKNIYNYSLCRKRVYSPRLMIRVNTMNGKRSSYLLITLSLVAVLVLAFAAGCTGNESKTPVATTVPTTSPIVGATQAPVSTTAQPVMITAPVSIRSETDYQDQWFNNRPADCPEGS